MLTAFVFAGNVSAATPYDTYTYAYSGNVQLSPAAYAPPEKTAEP